MKRGLIAILASAAVAAACWLQGTSAQNDNSLSPDEKILHEAKIGTDGPALLEFFRKNTPSDANRQRLARAIQLLGDNSFAVRVKASGELVEAGRFALPFLHAALGDPDPEIDRRAERCLKEIKADSEKMLTIAAARLLEQRKPEGSIDVLLAYLPSAGDQAQYTILDVLTRLGERDGKPVPALAKAATDREPLRRLAAVRVLARSAPEHRKALRPLLNDPEPRVRFQTVLSLVEHGDKLLVPDLLGFLTNGPEEFARETEDLMYQIAGEPLAFPGIESRNPASRQKCRAARVGWWQQKKDKVDLARLKEAAAHPSIFGEQVREFDFNMTVASLQVLPSGRFLVAHTARGRVVELDINNKEYWECQVGDPVDARRLPNGNTLITSRSENAVIEFNRVGKEAWRRKALSGRVSCARRY